MKATGFASRAFEHSLRTPFKKSKGPLPPARKFYYLRLMRVSIRHNYYNRSRDECPDFAIYPTASSTELMHSLGLIFKDEGIGFSILYDVRRKDVLLQYLRRQEWPESSKHCWSRLSFVLSLTNPYFLNFTDVPINLNPINENFYFTNREARRYPSGEIILNPGYRQEKLPVVPVQFGIDVTSRVKEVEVQSIAQVGEGSQEAVICKPRCVPVALLAEKNPATITCDEARECKGLHELKRQDDPKCSCTNKIYLDFSSLPEDKYTLKKLFYPSSSTATEKSCEVLYTEAYPLPLCFINLFFTTPTGERPKLFPVRNLFHGVPEIESINYELKFERRSTYWNYFIVPQTGESVENLKIEGEPAIQFHGPCSVYLPNGEKAYRFVSKKPLPFIQQSPFHFRLTGEIGTTAQNSTLMRRLPLATIEQVLRDELASCLSLAGSIYPGAKKDCRKLKAQICRCVCADMQINECMKYIRRVCADPESPDCLKLKLGCSKIYSDTYVYV